jgi:hypothetical protein
MRIALAIVFAWLAYSAPAWSQTETRPLTVGIYAPSVAFADSSARLAYVQGLADAIQKRSRRPTNAKAFIRYRDLVAAKVDFAILDGICVAVRGSKVLATAKIAGGGDQHWGLYSLQPELPGLKGKRLAYVRTGCRDSDFLDNALFQSEVDTSKFFSELVPRLDAVSAVSAVRDYKAADALFSPPGLARGLTRLVEGPSVPNPGLVVMNDAVDQATVEVVARSAMEYRGAGIEGWTAPASYRDLEKRLSPRRKHPVFAEPEPVRFNGADAVVMPKSSYKTVPLRQHFWLPESP